MTHFPSFDDWLRENREDLEDEWREEDEEYSSGGAEFRQWVRLQYDQERESYLRSLRR